MTFSVVNIGIVCVLAAGKLHKDLFYERYSKISLQSKCDDEERVCGSKTAENRKDPTCWEHNR
jgi:hypothetical protein